MDRNELYRLIYRKDKEFQRNKLKRSLLAMLFHAAVVFIGAYMITNKFSGWSLDVVLESIAISAVYGVVAFFINATIYGNLSIKGREENETLERLKKQLDEMDDNK